MGNPYADPERSTKKSRDWVKAVLEKGCYICGRCGLKEHLEADHIKDWRNYPELRFDVENGRIRCSECHKFETVLKEIQLYLDYEIRQGQVDRIKIYQRRIEILQELNTPERIFNGGKYISYWTDHSIRKLPKRIPIKKEITVENLINRQLKLVNWEKALSDKEE